MKEQINNPLIEYLRQVLPDRHNLLAWVHELRPEVFRHPEGLTYQVLVLQHHSPIGLVMVHPMVIGVN